MEKYQRVLSRESMGEVRQIVLRSKEMLEAMQNEHADEVLLVGIGYDKGKKKHGCIIERQVY